MPRNLQPGCGESGAKVNHWRSPTSGQNERPLYTAAVRSHWLEQSPPPGEMWPRPERGSGSRGERQLGPSMKYAPRAAGWNSALSWPARPPSPAAWFWLPACRDFMQGQPAQGEAWLINPPVCPSQRALGRRVLWIECWCLPQISYVESL